MVLLKIVSNSFFVIYLIIIDNFNFLLKAIYKLGIKNLWTILYDFMESYI